MARVGNTYSRTCTVEMTVKYNFVVSNLSINRRLTRNYCRKDLMNCILSSNVSFEPSVCECVCDAGPTSHQAVLKWTTPPKRFVTLPLSIATNMLRLSFLLLQIDDNYCSYFLMSNLFDTLYSEAKSLLLLLELNAHINLSYTGSCYCQSLTQIS